MWLQDQGKDGEKQNRDQKNKKNKNWERKPHFVEMKGGPRKTKQEKKKRNTMEEVEEKT